MRKTETILTTLFSLLAFSVFFFAGPTSAQVPEPYVACENTDSPEFHSLRPYQKSACNQEVVDTSQFCGNRLVLTDSVTRVQTTPVNRAPNCTRIDTNRYSCFYEVKGKTANYEIDLSQASLPILGNTEKVTNSQNQGEDLDDAEKTNEYVSWYLNGVTGRAENQPLSDSPEDIRKIIDFSGPIKKLLPQETQNELRANTVKKAVATQDGDSDERHDQVVGCTYGPIIPLVGQILKIPGACYDGNLITDSFRVEHQLSEWENKLPPKASDFPTFQDYWKEYEEWRGKVCLQFEVPFLDGKKVLLCGEDITSPNYYSNLYSYIPFSSTEDRVGEVSVDEQSVSAASENLEISNVSLVTTPAELFFSHTEEVADLASVLQLTFAPSGGSTTGAPSLVSPAEFCDLKNVRTNDGDDLFAETITGSLAYDAEFSCEFSGTATASSCTKNVSVGLKVVTETPKADELWSRLVSGPAGIFKRIFPLVGEGGAIIGILDMPGATNVKYSGSGLVSAGNPEGRSGEEAELYFPHLGGISEYFLKGIQTILRPKGYGEPILSGAAGTFASSGEVDCNQSASSPSLKRILNKQQTFQLALDWIGGQSGNHVLECYNDVIGKAKSAGVNAALTLLIWLNESNASNYDLSPADFGIRALDNEGFNAQITRFLNLPSSYRGNYPACFGKGNDTISFLRIFMSGNCTDQEGLNYANGIVGKWNYVTSCPFPQSPNSTSCP
jgi:hypothetical protein